MIKIKANIRNDSRAVPGVFNADTGYSGLKLIGQVLVLRFLK
jgi:hypothetical protein